MAEKLKKSKMTLDKLALMSQREFLSIDKKIRHIRENMATKDDLRHFATKDDLVHFATKDDLVHFATKDDLVHFATKDDLRHFATKDDLRLTEVRVLQAVDGIATKFDRAEKEGAAHDALHKHITDDLHHHDQRIKKLEAKV